MVSTVNTGTINMPKILRHIGTRTSNVREILFQRDAIYNKSTKTTKADDSALSGPAVNFGYDVSTTLHRAVVPMTRFIILVHQS